VPVCTRQLVTPDHVTIHVPLLPKLEGLGFTASVSGVREAVRIFFVSFSLFAAAALCSAAASSAAAFSAAAFFSVAILSASAFSAAALSATAFSVAAFFSAAVRSAAAFSMAVCSAALASSAAFFSASISLASWARARLAYGPVGWTCRKSFHVSFVARYSKTHNNRAAHRRYYL
jgi:hypothetical protein